MNWLKAGDTISGQEGRAFTTIDGNVEEAFYIKNFEAKANKEKTDVKTLGKRGTQHKANGWSGDGSMNIYYVTSLFRKLMYEYIKTGKDTYFDVMVVNEDPSSSIGKQTVVVKDVNLNSVVMAKLDTDSNVLDEDVDFTWDDIEVLDTFGKPVLGN